MTDEILVHRVGWAMYIVGFFMVLQAASEGGVFTPVIIGLFVVSAGAGLMSV